LSGKGMCKASTSGASFKDNGSRSYPEVGEDKRGIGGIHDLGSVR
jgi:hypothetical protein